MTKLMEIERKLSKHGFKLRERCSVTIVSSDTHLVFIDAPRRLSNCETEYLVTLCTEDLGEVAQERVVGYVESLERANELLFAQLDDDDQLAACGYSPPSEGL